MSGVHAGDENQKSRREMLEEWKAAKAQQKQTATAIKAQRVPVPDFHSERKLNTGAVRVQVHTPGAHLATPALRVPEHGRTVCDEDGDATTTPIMAGGRAKTASRMADSVHKASIIINVPAVEHRTVVAEESRKVDEKVISTPAQKPPATASSLRKQVSFNHVVEPEKKAPSTQLRRQATWSALTPKERKHVSFAPVTETKAVNRVHRFVPSTSNVAATTSNASAPNQMVELRLSSALHAAHRHTKAGNLILARRIYTGMLCDRDRFQNVEASAQFWIQFALFEEHCDKYVAALKLYERGLNAGAQPNGEVESNLYVFMMRMDDRLERATKGGASVEEVKELQEFVSCIRAKEAEQNIQTKSADVNENKESTAAIINNDNNVASASVAGSGAVVVAPAPEIERSWQIEHRNASEIALLAGKDVSQLMEQRVATTDSQKVDAEATRFEQEGPRRSARLATKERKNYADPACLIPWWLREDATWDF